MARDLDPAAVARLAALGRAAADEGVTPDVDLGRFEPIREIGRGGMGVVYEAHDRQLDRRVALKRIQPTPGVAGAQIRQRFVREASAVARLRHPHIAQVYEATPDYIAMQLVDGVDLAAWSRGVDERAIAAVLQDAAEAVQHAHEHGVVHRDLKPSNLIVEAGHVYVVDFGLAKERGLGAGDLSVTGALLGTPGFMAPEQARGATAECDERADVYGLGATLWSCLSGGRAPFEGEDVVAVLRSVQEDSPPRLDGVDRDLETIARCALEKEPDRRYPSARAFGADLRRWLEGRPIGARPPSPGYRLRRLVARHRQLVRVAVALTLVLGVGATLWILDERTRRLTAQSALDLSARVVQLLADAEDYGRVQEMDSRRFKLIEAERRCRTFLAEDAEVAQAHFLLGRVLRRLGAERFEAARSALDAAIALDPDFTAARFERGMLLADQWDREPRTGGDSLVLGHHLEQACTDLRMGLAAARSRESIAVRSADVLFGEARLAALTDRTAEAQDALERLLLLAPDHVEGLRLLAQMTPDPTRRSWLAARSMDLQRGLSVGDSQALVGVDQSIAVGGVLADLPTDHPDHPRDVLVHAFRGLKRILRADALRAQGQSALAKIELEAARRDHDQALQVQGAEAFAVVRNNRAVTWLRAAEVCLADGRVFDATGAWLQALEDLEVAVRRQPEFATALANLALAECALAAQQRVGGLVAEAAARERVAVGYAERALLLAPVAWRPRLRAIVDSAGRRMDVTDERATSTGR